MTSDVRIECIRKQDRYDPTQRITHIGGRNADGKRWILTLDEAIRGSGTSWNFYVQQGGRRVEVEVAKSRAGNLYLKTVADSYEPNNLLSLPECP